MRKWQPVAYIVVGLVVIALVATQRFADTPEGARSRFLAGVFVVLGLATVGIRAAGLFGKD